MNTNLVDGTRVYSTIKLSQSDDACLQIGQWLRNSRQGSMVAPSHPVESWLGPSWLKHKQWPSLVRSSGLKLTHSWARLAWKQKFWWWLTEVELHPETSPILWNWSWATGERIGLLNFEFAAVAAAKWTNQASVRIAPVWVVTGLPVGRASVVHTVRCFHFCSWAFENPGNGFRN